MASTSPNRINFNPEELNKLVGQFQHILLDFLTNIRDRPVIAPDLERIILELSEEALSTDGLGVTRAIEEFKLNIEPGLTNTAGPRSFPWVTGGVTPAALLGAFYQIMYDQNIMVSGASIGPKLESETIKLLLDLFELPRDKFEGTFTTGATASNLCALATARQWWGTQYEINIASDGLFGLPPLEVYSSSPHASVYKSLGILGCGRKSLNIIPHLSDKEAMDIAALETALSKSTAKAKIVIASAATVNSGDFDNLDSIAAICRKYNAWLHVDAAFGLFARCSPDYLALTTGIDAADSITADGHKWLNVPYDCGILFIKRDHKQYLLSAFSSAAAYMSDAADEPMNKGVENSRALRALPVWTTLKAYGRLGYQELIERNCMFAQAVATIVNKMEYYILLAPVKLNIVLFKAQDISNPEQNQALLKRINGAGKIFITSTVYEGKAALRLAVCNWMTDIDKDLKAVEEALNQGMLAR